MSFRRIFSFVALSFALLSVSNVAIAQHDNNSEASKETAHAEKKGFNASEVIFGHIRDSHYWHLFDINGEPVAMPLPVILYDNQKGLSIFSASKFHHGHEAYNGYEIDPNNKMKEKIILVNPMPGQEVKDFSITKNALSIIISVVLLLWIMLSVAGKYKKNGVMTAPTGMQNAIEPIITFIRDEVAKPNLGNKYATYMPLILTIFFFIWINNMLGLIPGGANIVGNIAFTGCLALISFVIMIAKANKHFWGHLLNPPGVPLGIKFLLVPIEIMSLLIKPVALMIRLFANILAGHIVILSVISMIFIFGALNSVAGWGFMPVSIAFSIFMILLDLMVAAIQAFIFANLTAVFIGQSIEEGHGHDDGQDYHVSENEIIA